jgi:hypothetical protein
MCSFYDCLAFDTNLGSPEHGMLDNLVPGHKACLKKLGINGAVVLSRSFSDLQRKLHMYYSYASTPESARCEYMLLLMKIPCNLTGTLQLLCHLEWDHIIAQSMGGKNTPDNLHMISAHLNKSVGNADTREWAIQNGYGALRTEPPCMSMLEHVRALKWWTGKESFPLEKMRLDEVRRSMKSSWPSITRLGLPGQTRMTSMLQKRPVLHVPTLSNKRARSRGQKCSRPQCKQIFGSDDDIKSKTVKGRLYCMRHAESEILRNNFFGWNSNCDDSEEVESDSSDTAQEDH